MIVMNKNQYIQGSSVLAPVEETVKKRKVKKTTKKNNKKEKIKIIKNILLIFVIGFVLIWRYAIIYNMQKNLGDIHHNIRTINKENENLKIHLVKYSSVENIEDSALSEIHMLKPDRGQIMYLKLDKDNFGLDKKESEAKEKINEGVFAKIKEKLF